MRSLRYLNERTLFPFPTEAGHSGVREIACPLFFSQHLQPAVELFAEMVLHLLQRLHGNRHLLARGTVRLLAGGEVETLTVTF
jgi:hypothetical protein